MKAPIFFLLLVAFSSDAFAQELSPAKLLQPPTDTWGTYNGDYSGRRFSPLTQINSTNVHALALAWATRFGGGANVSIKSTPLMVNGILYFTAPNHVWAAD